MPPDGSAPADTIPRATTYVICSSMYKMIREFAHEQLVTNDKSQEIARQHATYFLTLVEETEPKLTGSAQQGWLNHLEAEHDNIRAALRWARDTGAVEIGLRLAGALWRFWESHGHFPEGRKWLDYWLTCPMGDTNGAPMWTRAKALSGAARLADRQGAYMQSEELAAESVALYRAIGDHPGIAHALNALATAVADQHDYVRAEAWFTESWSYGGNSAIAMTRQ